MESEISLPYSKDMTTGTYSRPDIFSSLLQTHTHKSLCSKNHFNIIAHVSQVIFSL